MFDFSDIQELIQEQEALEEKVKETQKEEDKDAV